MIFYFPDLETLRLAITSGVVPPAVSLAPAVAGVDEEGHLWVQPSASLPRGMQAALGRMGVQAVKTNGKLQGDPYHNWLQLIPLRKEPMPALSGQAPVLFELPGADRLADLVGEMLRLGNDRQGFRSLEDGKDGRVLLRVVGPPYYSLLQALDRSRPDAPRAYVESGPRFWVEVGHAHPLADRIKAPEGKLLLVRPPDDWEFLDESPFRDVYEVLEFNVPAPRVRWKEADLDRRIKVPLRLARGGSAEYTELWVLRDRPVEQLDSLVQESDDQLLGRLSFAVAGPDQPRCIVLRARPSKQAPPELALDAVKFRSYLKLPNLFVPCGRQLYPPLRRDAVRRLLAEDPALVTWLYPNPDGAFTPESLPDESFRPLSDWIDYVLDHDRQALDAWVGAARFDFEPFVCSEEKADRPKKSGPQKERRSGEQDEEPLEVLPVPEDQVEVVDKSRRKKKKGEEQAEFSRVKPSQLQERLHELENQFLALKSPLEAPERRELWGAMAQLNTALGHTADATVCWVNVLWEADPPPEELLWGWFQAESKGKAKPDMPGAELDRLLAQKDPPAAEVRALAAGLAWAAHQDRPPPSLVQRLSRVQLFLETHEQRFLPVRAIWLAWSALVRMSQGDVLTLARTRDRLLERLYQTGLSSDLDLPSFLRFAGQQGGERYRAVRDRVLALHDLARCWIRPNPLVPAARTGAYVDLTFAFGLARLGENTECRKLLEKAREEMPHDDEVHSFLFQAYHYRIQQALEGKPHAGPLPSEQLEYLETLGRELPRMDPGQQKRTRDNIYRIDRLRQRSDILDPQEKIEPYRRFFGHILGELEQELALLFDVSDRQELATRLNRLVQSSAGKPPATRATVLKTALELSPRVGEALALDLLKRVLPLLAQLPEPEAQAGLLEKALVVAAHFDQADLVQAFVAAFHRLLEAQQKDPALARTLHSLVAQCFKGLRKLGLRDEIDRLLRRTAELVLQGEDLEGVHRRLQKAAGAAGTMDWPGALRTLLHIAGGWFYFSQDDRARQVLDEVRDVLLEGDLQPWQQTELACTYASVLGQAPVEEALTRVEELFQHLERVRDSFSTNSHYCVSELRLVESVVMALTSDEFAMGAAVRRWLDDEEFLVRRRIHQDVRKAMAAAGL